MRKNVSDISKEHNFYVYGVSYSGNPKDNTVMYIGKKVEHLVSSLKDVHESLIFVENGITVPEEYKQYNCFIFTDNPQFEYAKYISDFAEYERKQEMALGYDLTKGGYYIGKNVEIGKNSYIEPGVLIGHNVVIGDNATIHAGAKIKHAVIGDNFICAENTSIGNDSFNVTYDKNKNRYRIPTFGNVIMGQSVEIGACSTIARGACESTVIGDYVKIDNLVYIAHDVHLGDNTEVTAGSMVGGFAEIGRKSFLGVNSSIKNRIYIGENCIVGMGTNVLNSIEDNSIVVGNPAKPIKK